MKSILNDTNMSKESARRVLSQYHIKPTAQRLDIARITLYKDQHLSAEDVIMRLNSNTDGISRATVYNTLNLFESEIKCPEPGVPCVCDIHYQQSII